MLTIRSRAFDEILTQSGILPECHEKLLQALSMKHDRDFLEGLPAGNLDERGWPLEAACQHIGVHDLVLPDKQGRVMPAAIAGYCFPSGRTIIRVRRFIAEHEIQGVMNVHKLLLRAAGIEVK